METTRKELADDRKLNKAQEERYISKKKIKKGSDDVLTIDKNMKKEGDNKMLGEYLFKLD